MNPKNPVIFTEEYKTLIKDDLEKLDEFYINLNETEVRKVKKRALEMMKHQKMVDENGKSKTPWLIKLVFDKSYKYIAIRMLYKEELIAFGYNYRGECLSENEWISYKQMCNRQKYRKDVI